MAKITVQDTSNMAGVSLGTVSRIIHSPHLVRKETRERINRVIDRRFLPIKPNSMESETKSEFRRDKVMDIEFNLNA